MSLLRNSIILGGVTSFTTAVAAAILGRKAGTTASAPVNAISHILWGDEALHRDRTDVRHTVVGIALNTAAQTSWALLHEWLFSKTKEKTLPNALATGAAVATAAYVTDFHVVPKRLTPGFEQRLPKRSLIGLYGVMAVTLALASLDRRR